MNRKKAILSMLFASTSFAFMAATIKLSGGKVPLMQQILFRNLIIMLLTFVLIKKSGVGIIPAREVRIDLLFRCMCGFGGMICFFYANRHLALADAQILQKISPFFVTIFSVLILKEVLHRGKVIALVFAFLGAIIVIQPRGEYDLFPFLVGLLGAVFAGFAYTFLRKLKNEPGIRIIFWFGMLSLVCSLPIVVMNFEPLPFKYWLMMIMIGVFAGMGQYFITKAFKYAPASEVSIFDYTGLIISPIIGYFLFRDVLTIRTALGMVLIVLSGYFSYRWNKNRIKDK